MKEPVSTHHQFESIGDYLSIQISTQTPKPKTNRDKNCQVETTPRSQECVNDPSSEIPCDKSPPNPEYERESPKAPLNQECEGKPPQAPTLREKSQSDCVEGEREREKIVHNESLDDLVENKSFEKKTL